MRECTPDSPRTLSSDYAASYYDGHSGPPYTYEQPHWRTFFGGVADAVVATLAPSSVYDAGCGIGLLVRALAERGVDARGGDISEFAVAGAPEGLRERLEVHDLAQPLSQRYDLVCCIEVLEHMSPVDAAQAIANICAATDTVLFSSTPDDFAQPTHVNVRSAASWAQDFARHGFFRRTDVDASFLSPWAVLFQRQPLTAPQVAGGYESVLAPLWREVLAKREALLAAQRELDALRSGTDTERTVLRQQVDELTRLRDRAVQEREDVAADRDRLIDAVSRVREGGDERDSLARLALVDELIGLRAQLAQARILAENARTQAQAEALAEARAQVQAEAQAAEQVEVAKVREDLVAVHADLHHSRLQEQRLRAELDETVRAHQRELELIRQSSTWKAGRALLTPVVLARRVRRPR
ncbi:class I SAM-dependent methyltransferase [Blastococcus capsensis]|uniref:class I SAM-dependent methyltransferase n=1 Tax=Blastococcus capsensis TaxID=1564163 RepID=UPI0025418271|nr:methyltransferase domain-containing protein [Blastococcus capsensis]MDK3256145.1 methyltransferase domain-containing protein [Blastococcus capsensis]